MVHKELSVETPSELIVETTVDQKVDTEQNHRVKSRIPIFRTGRRSSREDRLSPNSLEVVFMSRKKSENTKQTSRKKPPLIRRKASTNLLTDSTTRKSAPEEMVLFENNMAKLSTESTKSLKNIWTPKLKLLEEDSTIKKTCNSATKTGKIQLTKSKDEVRADFLEDDSTVTRKDIKTPTNISETHIAKPLNNVEDEDAETPDKDSILGLGFSESLPSRYSDHNTRFGAFNSLLGLIKQRAAPVSLFSFMFMGRSSRNVKARYSTLENTSLTEEEQPTEIKWMSIDSRECSPTPSEEEIRYNTWENATSVIYFRNLVSEAKKDLNSKGEMWGNLLNDEMQNLNESVIGEIRSIVGQAQLLISERFTQFEGLVTKFEKPSQNHEIVTSDDLEGFWEMVNFQIKDVHEKFEKLQKLKENNWNEIEPKNGTLKPKKSKTKVSGLRPPTKFSKSHKEDAKKRLQEAKRAMQERTKNQSNNFASQGDGLNQKLIID